MHGMEVLGQFLHIAYEKCNGDLMYKNKSYNAELQTDLHVHGKENYESGK